MSLTTLNQTLQRIADNDKEWDKFNDAQIEKKIYGDDEICQTQQ